MAPTWPAIRSSVTCFNFTGRMTGQSRIAAGYTPGCSC
ncbi:hypothetical protein PCLA_11f0289 [Pseudomonas citronellolis]|nr:hypothetical protein PCLA_11f0289 [Pseudomonas citronellolis]